MLKDEKDKSGCLARSENIGPQVHSGDLVLSHVLESLPVLGIQQGAAFKPLGDQLLAQRRPPHEAAETIRQRGLTADNLDSATKRNNVRFLHEYRDSTTTVVKVNNPRRMTNNNEPCSVIYMPATHRKIAQRVTQVRNRELSYDQSTYAGRLNLAIRAKAQANAGSYQQSQVLADIQRAVGRSLDAPMLVSQQTLSKLQHGKQHECADTPAIAVALGVSPMWLAYGIGPPSLIEEMRLRGR